MRGLLSPLEGLHPVGSLFSRSPAPPSPLHPHRPSSSSPPLHPHRPSSSSPASPLGFLGLCLSVLHSQWLSGLGIWTVLT